MYLNNFVSAATKFASMNGTTPTIFAASTSAVTDLMGLRDKTLFQIFIARTGHLVRSLSPHAGEFKMDGGFNWGASPSFLAVAISILAICSIIVFSVVRGARHRRQRKASLRRDLERYLRGLDSTLHTQHLQPDHRNRLSFDALHTVVTRAQHDGYSRRARFPQHNISEQPLHQVRRHPGVWPSSSQLYNYHWMTANARHSPQCGSSMSPPRYAERIADVETGLNCTNDKDRNGKLESTDATTGQDEKKED